MLNSLHILQKSLQINILSVDRPHRKRVRCRPNGTVGLGRAPATTRAEAEEIMNKVNNRK